MKKSALRLFFKRESWMSIVPHTGYFTALVFTIAQLAHISPTLAHSGNWEDDMQQEATSFARIDAGGNGTYTDSDGNVWGLDNSFIFGDPASSSKPIDVLGTNEDGLFQTYRYARQSAEFGFDIPVNTDGEYAVILYMVEPYFGVPGYASGGTGKRVFDVSVEGTTVLDNYDLNAIVSPGTLVAHTVENITAADGIISIRLVSEVNNAIISAIEVVEIDEEPPAPVLLTRLNAGGSGAYTDGDSNEWADDDPLVTGASRTASKSFDVVGTEDDGLYLSYRFAQPDANGLGQDFGYDIPVPASGSFTVRLHFLEPYFGVPGLGPGGIGRRVFDVALEGNTVLDDVDLNTIVTPGTTWVTTFEDIAVSDGNLSINFQSEVNNAIISAVEVLSQSTPSQPVFTGVDPANGATNVPINGFQITVGVVTPDGYELDETTLSGNVNLYKETTLGDEVLITSNVNDTGGGDAVILTPSEALEPSTKYIFRIEGVQANKIGDFQDRLTFASFASSFTTSADDDTNPVDLRGVSFIKVTGAQLGQGVDDRFSSLVIGPDGKLYGSTLAGTIKRWSINADGTLSNLQTLTPSLSGSPHPETGVTPGQPRLIIGLCFGPEATANNLVAYITHSAAVLSDGPEWDGKITRLSGPNLGQVQDVVIHLPRSKKDHLTNSIITGPDGHLYFTQGSNTAGGAPDPAWGNRPERLLSAAALKLELDKLPSNLPLSAYTTDNISVINNAPGNSIAMSDGTYNPYATNSPLTIFASGVRNAYDLVWHSNGFLYIPTNGTAGNNTSSPNAPASAGYVPVRRIDGSIATDASIPALNGGETQKDWLFKASFQTYHGHPNPLRGEFVLNHGGITYDGIPGQTGPYVDVAKYPDNLGPDYGFVPPAYDFAKNKSPNGAIEYRSDAFDGKLKGMLMVVRFSGQDDVMVMRPGESSGEILEVYESVVGMQNFDDPLDLVEDPNTGNIYVAQYDRGDDVNQKLVLLRVNETEGENPMAMDYYFVDAETDEIVEGPIIDGDVVDISNVNEFSIFVERYPAGTARMNFNILDGPYAGHNKTEGVTPYAIFGDTPRGDYIGQPISDGDQFTIRMRALDGDGNILVEETFSFSASSSGARTQTEGDIPTDAHPLQAPTVYPNPLLEDGLLHVVVGTAAEEVAVRLTDILGREYLRETIKVANDGEFLVDLRHLSPNIYFLRVFDGRQTNIHKVVKD